MPRKVRVLILGSSGQLGSILNANLKKNEKLKVLNDNLKKKITNKNVKKYLNRFKDKADLIINCIAYTDVENSEKNKDKAVLLNEVFPKYLSEFCYKNNIILIHFSTDYVFNKKYFIKINENENYAPVNFYGKTKMKGEKWITKSNCKYLIFRISWLYSRSRKNFLNTILMKIKAGNNAHIISDNFGIPTSSNFISNFFNSNLFEFLKKKNQCEIFHLVPSGYCSWYIFSKEIENVFFPKKKISYLYPISYKKYASLAKRPKYSIMNNQKVKKYFNYKILNWKFYLKYYKHN
jgi:dTDP-4-dehydrorhamnose reductase